MNHNKDKTNISYTSHVSLWGLPACLRAVVTPASVSSELKKKNEMSLFVCSSVETLWVMSVYFQAQFTWELVRFRHSFLSVGDACCAVIFLWKTPESEDSLISHKANEGVCTTSCHYWKRKRLKSVGPIARMKSDSLFSHALLLSPSSSSSIPSYRGFPSTALSSFSASYSFSS